MTLEEFISIMAFMAFPFAGTWLVFAAVGAVKELIFGFRQGHVDSFIIDEFGWQVTGKKADKGSVRYLLGLLRSALVIFSLITVAALLIFLGPFVFINRFAYLRPAGDSVYIVYIMILMIYTFALGNIIHSRSSDEKARVYRYGIDLGKFYSGPFKKYTIAGSSLFPRTQLMIDWNQIEQVHIDRRIIPLPKLVVKTNGRYIIKHIAIQEIDITERSLIEYAGGRYRIPV